MQGLPAATMLEIMFKVVKAVEQGSKHIVGQQVDEDFDSKACAMAGWRPHVLRVLSSCGVQATDRGCSRIRSRECPGEQMDSPVGASAAVTDTRPVAVQKRSDALLSVLLALHPLTTAEYAIAHVAVTDLWEAVSPEDRPYPLLQLLVQQQDKALEACEDLLRHQSSMQSMEDIEKGITRLVRQIRVVRASIPVPTKATTAETIGTVQPAGAACGGTAAGQECGAANTQGGRQKAEQVDQTSERGRWI